MKDKITIIGGGLAGWATASVFSDNGYIVDVFDKKNENFGSQQISTNGWLALSKLIDIKKIKPFFEPFNKIQIKFMDASQRIEQLCSLDFDNEAVNYGSIERESIIKLLKESALKKGSITVHNSHIKHIISNNGINEIIDENQNIFVSTSIIGADSINGVSRKFVMGSEAKSKHKKVFRGISFNYSSYQLARSLLQLIITPDGHFVIYPTIINKRRATNYIFVPINNRFKSPEIDNKILSYLIPDDIEWKTTFFSNICTENNVIHKNGVLLVGDAGTSMPPHIAQAGNQILEDAVFIKELLQEKNNFNQMINLFIKERYVKKNMIAKKSENVGKILSAQKLVGEFRNLSLKFYGNEIVKSILNPIWMCDFNE